MNAVLINKQHLNYTSKKTGKQVDGFAISYLKKKRNPDSEFFGYDVGNDFISNTPDNQYLINALNGINPGDHFEAIYECDGKFNFLVDLVGHEKYFDFTMII